MSEDTPWVDRDQPPTGLKLRYDSDEPPTVTLTEFLLARIAEDESRIRDGWDSDGKARVAVMWTGAEPGYTTVAIDQADDIWVADGREVTDARHVSILFDPARVLADCEAKRRIVALHQPEGGYSPPDAWYGHENRCQECGHVELVAGLGQRGSQHAWPCRTFRLLALPYADHPDYHSDWRP